MIASLAIAAAALLTLLGFVKPAIESVFGCDECSLGTPPIVLIAIPSVYVLLAIGILSWPSPGLVRTTAIASAVAAVLSIGPVVQASGPTAATAILCLFGASTVLLATPIGGRAGRWARASWIVAIIVALVLWQLDTLGSNFMLTEPVGPQPAFLILATVLLGAGVLSIGLERLEARRALSEAVG